MSRHENGYYQTSMFRKRKYVVRKLSGEVMYVNSRKAPAMRYASVFTNLTHTVLQVRKINRKGDVLNNWIVGDVFTKGDDW